MIKKLKPFQPPIFGNEATEVEEIAKPHPLIIDVVLREVFKYLDSSSLESLHKTMKNARSVCHKWNEHMSPQFSSRSIIMKRSDTHLDSLIKTFPITQDPHLDLMPFKITALKISPEWFEKEQFRQWLKFHGEKLSRVTSLRKINLERDLFPLLQEWCKNVEELTLDEVMVDEDFDNDLSAEDLEEILIFLDSWHPMNNLKRLTLATVNSNTSKYPHWPAFLILAKAFLIIAKAKNLESLTLNCSLPEYLSFPIVPHTEHLFEDLTVRIRKVFDTLKLREIRIHVKNNISVVSNLTLIAGTLVKCHVHVEDGKRVNNPGDGFPQLVKMEEFIYSHSSGFIGYFEQFECSDIQEKHCDFYYNGDETQVLVTSQMIINSMPRLRSWIVKQSDATWMSKGCVSNWYFTIWSCAYGWCRHVEEILVRMEVTEDEVAPSTTHKCLEKLEFSCCFKEPELILNLTSAFVNLKDLSIWIRSNELFEFFANLTSLENLQRFKVQLSKAVLDFPTTINSNLPLFKNLKELSFEKCNGIRDRKAVHCIAHVDEACAGFMECKTLEILSFKSMKIDVKELNILREALLKSNPNLALNEDFCCFD